jgi:hypothetical protein
MNRLIITLIAFCAIFLLSNCKDNPPFDQTYRLIIENKSSDRIYFLVGFAYPDTTIPSGNQNLIAVESNSKAPYDSDESWEEVFSKLPKDTLIIYAFNSDTIQKYTWPEIVSKYKISKRYDLSYNNLLDNNWIVTYP